MARHLLDSDVLIAFLRGSPPAIVLVEEICRADVPAISSLSFFELWVGVRPREEEVVERFLSSLWILSVDQSIAREAAIYVRGYRRRGITLGSVDALIAATAKVHGLILVTSNSRDFPMTDIEKRAPSAQP